MIIVTHMPSPVAVHVQQVQMVASVLCDIFIHTSALSTGLEQTGNVTKANVEAAIRHLAGSSSDSGPQHITVIDAFKV